MLRKQYIVSLLVVLFTFIFVGAALAGENDYSGILGSDQFSFEDSEANMDMAVSNHAYDEDHLALVGTEAGNWQYDANAERTPAQQAAIERDYDQSRLSDVGTEAGNWQYRFNSSESPVCSSC